ncbi:unnamed protein product [Cladocopium goreaui]|uniref:Uncharacterized protein n=1 Tax=Cladocopium goreaui TaxID=2562237 RepID=A0A9P1C6B3_9DINO|nr:unnamed protein product [Cladocopium goreaui]
MTPMTPTSTTSSTSSTSLSGPTKPAAPKPERPQTLDVVRRSKLISGTSTRISTMDSVPEDLPTECSGCGLDSASSRQTPSLQELVQNRPSNKTRARERLLAATYVANSTIFD